MQQAKVSDDYSDLFVCIANWEEVVIYLHRKGWKNRNFRANKVLKNPNKGS